MMKSLVKNKKYQGAISKNKKWHFFITYNSNIFFISMGLLIFYLFILIYLFLHFLQHDRIFIHIFILGSLCIFTKLIS